MFEHNIYISLTLTDTCNINYQQNTMYVVDVFHDIKFEYIKDS